MSLFQKSVLNKYLNELDKTAVDLAFEKYKTYFFNPVIQQNIRESKEEQFQEGFLRELFVNIFGYTLNPNPDYNLTTEFKNQTGAKKADGAILKDGKAVGVIELKSTKTKDLETVRQQAFDYKANHSSCVYVITSNFQKIRFYINNAVEFEEFDLFIISEERFKLLYLCLNSANLLSDLPLKIKNASLLEEEQITKKFYSDYSFFKKELFEDIASRNESIEGVSKLDLYKKTQKLLDRFLFIFFAEDRGLLPPNSISRMIKRWDVLKDEDAYKPLYDIYKQYFGYLNKGRKGKVPADDIHEYNGGLFLADELLDKIEIDDDILLKHTSVLTNYDFDSQVDVNILGHIFEHSLNEIESTTAELEGVDFDKQKSKRKKDGVFYTPKYITKYIVDNTVGKLCEEKKEELGINDEEFTPNRKKGTKKKLLASLDAYRKWLLELTICDPACGSGAFLNQALEYLISEHHYIDELNAQLFGSTMVFQDVENRILEKNIFGVDINEESVDIARLSLWLRTAQLGRKLTTLNKNIKCGNSLIDDPEVAGDKAFNWEKEFPDVFAKGGFDVVIGNPPYVQHRKLFHLSQAFKDRYKVYSGTSDLSVYFFEKGIGLIKQNGYLGYINTNKFFNSEYGQPLREYLSSFKIDEIVNFEQAAIFKEALVSSTILLIQKKNPADNIRYIEFNKESITPEKFEIEKISRLQLFSITYLKTNSWLFRNPKISTLIDKIKSSGIPFGELENVKINRGITTGYDDAFIIDYLKYNDLIAIDSISQEILKPLLKGKHIRRYSIDQSNLWLINAHNGLKDHTERINLQETYPAIYSHINQINIDSNGKVEKRSDKGKHWSNLRNCAFLQEFEKPKVVWGLISGNWSFALDNSKNYLTSASYFLTSKVFNIELFLGLMNSSLFRFYFENVGERTAGGAYVLKKVSIEKFIYPTEINKEQEDSILQLINIIQLSINGLITIKSAYNQYLLSQYSDIELKKKLQNWHELEFGEFIAELNKAIKKAGGQKLNKMDEMEWMEVFETKKAEAKALKADIDKTEREIDQIVYELYGLTEEEIGIVEGN